MFDRFLYWISRKIKCMVMRFSRSSMMKYVSNWNAFYNAKLPTLDEHLHKCVRVGITYIATDGVPIFLAVNKYAICRTNPRILGEFTHKKEKAEKMKNLNKKNGRQRFELDVYPKQCMWREF